jgi:hypothetical protein
MLEILILWQLCKNIGVKLRAKGRSPGGYQFMLVAMWFGGEIIGGILGVVMSGEAGAVAYLVAILGAIAGVVAAFVIVRSVAPINIDHPTGGFPIAPLPTTDPLEQRRS